MSDLLSPILVIILATFYGVLIIIILFQIYRKYKKIQMEAPSSSIHPHHHHHQQQKNPNAKVPTIITQPYSPSVSMAAATALPPSPPAAGFCSYYQNGVIWTSMPPAPAHATSIGESKQQKKSSDYSCTGCGCGGDCNPADCCCCCCLCDPACLPACECDPGCLAICECCACCVS